MVRRRHVEIQMRRMRFDIDDSLPVHWFRGNPWLTHFFNALSAVFPQGEKFFIASVRHFEDRIEDPKLRAEARGFAQQEGHHTHQHRVLNEVVERQGFPMRQYDEGLGFAFGRIRERRGPLEQLAITCALEHFTALLGNELLRHPELLDGVHPAVAPLWTWHAVEETEHKAVAFDVYEAVGGDYRTRVRALTRITPLLLSYIGAVQRDLLARDPVTVHRRDRIAGHAYLWGRPGVLRRILPDYARYYSPRFHPWNVDNSELIDAWKADNARYVMSSA